MTGGGECVIVKWDVKSMRKLCLVPRLGATLTNISLSFGKILGEIFHSFLYSNVLTLSFVWLIRHFFEGEKVYIPSLGDIHLMTSEFLR